MSAIYKHFKTVCKHKYAVFKECRACGIPVQGMIHDLSKFSITEFASSAKYFQGNRSPISAEKDAIGYSSAWLHHKGHNKHHWEYWTDFGSNGEVIPAKIPYKYVVEMICDWIGAGKVYSCGNWDQTDPLLYYKYVRPGRHFDKRTEKLILLFLNTICNCGLIGFHKLARNKSLKSCYERS